MAVRANERRNPRIDSFRVGSNSAGNSTSALSPLIPQQFAQNPPFGRALEALTAILAQYGRARMAAWARAADDDATRIVAVMFENTTLALALCCGISTAHIGAEIRSG